MSVYIKGTRRTFFWDILSDFLIKFLKSSSITGFDRGSVKTFNFSSSEAVSSFFARKICGTARTGTRKYQVRKLKKLSKNIVIAYSFSRISESIEYETSMRDLKTASTIKDFGNAAIEKRFSEIQIG